MDGADRAHIDQELADRIAGNAGHAHGCADRVSLDQGGNHLTALLNHQAIHTEIIRERLRNVKYDNRMNKRRFDAWVNRS